jgi:hypothetical protein
LELFHEYRASRDFTEYSWYALGALHAFHAGTVVALRCYLEPLTCDDRDWKAIDLAKAEFQKIAHLDGWQKLGEKAVKVFGILIRKAMEKKAILESSLGTNGITIGPQTTNEYDAQTANAANAMFSADSNGGGSMGFTPQYSGSLFPSYNQFDPNPLTNPNIQRETFNPAQLQGVGMPGVVGTNGSPDQTNWDAYWPKGMNLVCLPM